MPDQSMRKYEHEWRFWAKVKIGDGCWTWIGAKMPWGYGAFNVNGVAIRAHRYAYECLVGPIPEGMILDHSCCNRLCVNPAHLRVCTQSENSKNQTIREDNKSGCKGVWWDEQRGKWQAYINSNGKRHHLGRFDVYGDAVKAYEDAAFKLHGEFANLRGRRAA